MNRTISVKVWHIILGLGVCAVLAAGWASCSPHAEAATLTGRVVHPDGSPAAFVTLTVYDQSVAIGEEIKPVAGAMTWLDGEFAIKVPVTAAIARHARLNGGQLDIRVVAFAGEDEAQWGTSVELDSEGARFLPLDQPMTMKLYRRPAGIPPGLP